MKFKRLLPAALVFIAACSPSGPAARLSPSPRATPATSPSPLTPASPSPAGLAAPGPLHFNVTALATGLTAPWALAFDAGGAIWFTERPGRVRVIQNGALLAAPALTLNVAQRPGCEGGLLGIAVKEPYAYLYYTYAGPRGNVNRVSRFTIQGTALTAEHVLLDGIPGGSCYHDGGRLKIGPDGLLYLSTGETFVYQLAADPNNLSGKVLAMNLDGSGEHRVAWGFRNPQGLTWDAAGNLYVSNNGPTGEFGLCCHDSIYQVVAGGFYGWPWWAEDVRTGYPNPPAQARGLPIAGSGNTVWAPSGIAFFAPAGQQPELLVAELAGRAVRRLIIDRSNPGHVLSEDIVLSGYGRMRDVVAGPDGCLYALTSNRDGRGSPSPQDDQVLRLCPAK